MKLFLSVFLMLCVSVASAADKAAVPQMASVKGEVLEVKDVSSYSYLRLKTKDGETWAAVSKTPVKKGAQVTIENPMVMNNFVSKALNKTFDKVIFGNLAGSAGSMAGAGKAAEAVDVKVPKAIGSDARTVAEIVTKRADLKDKTVLVRGKVVKYNEAVMGKNWVHLRDGSGTASDNSNDLLVTTKDHVAIGDIVVAKGVVHTDKDFGAGYAYKVLIEGATVHK